MRYYLSHKIRGNAGSNASHDVQAKNCAEAIRVADILRGLFPKLELYVPAENEVFVRVAYDIGHLTIDEILDIDCKIIDHQDGLLVYVPDGDKLQGGREVEYLHAVTTGKRVCIFHTPEEAADWIEATYRKELI